jgi:hypothetical protein
VRGFFKQLPNLLYHLGYSQVICTFGQRYKYRGRLVGPSPILITHTTHSSDAFSTLAATCQQPGVGNSFYRTWTSRIGISDASILQVHESPPPSSSKEDSEGGAS